MKWRKKSFVVTLTIRLCKCTISPLQILTQRQTSQTVAKAYSNLKTEELSVLMHEPPCNVNKVQSWVTVHI